MRGRSAPSVNLGPPHISETTRARKSKFCTHFDGPSTLFGVNFFPLGACGGRSAPSVNLGPLISRKLLKLESTNFAHISTGPSTLMF